MDDITIDDIIGFHKSYDSTRNQYLEQQITRHGLEKSFINYDVIRDNPPDFNLELPSYHLYDQHSSGRCWCFASINAIESNIAHNLNIIPRRLILSANYLCFYDKLEKTNFLYNYIIEQNLTLPRLRQTIFSAQDPLQEGSYFNNFADIIYKYGLVPATAMPENQNTNYPERHFLRLWREKARRDAMTLFNLESHVSLYKLHQIKKQKLKEMYDFLSVICGNPPLQFDYHYHNRAGRHVHLQNYTPTQFRDEFLTLDLRKFILVCCDPLHKYYTYQTIDKLDNSLFHSNINYLNLPKTDMKRLAIMQLQSGLPVKFSTKIQPFNHQKLPILDTRLYNYSPLNITPLDYETGIKTQLVKAEHGMTILGVQIENNQPIRWKVENSHRNDSPQMYTMNDNFFDACVVSANIHADIILQANIDLSPKIC